MTEKMLIYPSASIQVRRSYLNEIGIPSIDTYSIAPYTMDVPHIPLREDHLVN